MQSISKQLRGAAIVLTAVLLTSGLPSDVGLAQSTAPVASSAVPSEPTIRALQEALKKEGIAVTVDGALNEATRAAIRTYQSQHHLPVTGEPDRATLDKLGVRASAAPAQPSTTGQAGSTDSASSKPPAPAQAPATAPQTAPGKEQQTQPGQGMMGRGKPMPGGMMPGGMRH